MINMRTEVRDITTYTIDIKRIVREYHNHPTHKFDNLSEMDNFLLKYKPSIVNNYVNSSIAIKKIVRLIRVFLVVQWLRIHLAMWGRWFNPCCRKTPHAAEQLSLCAMTAEPACCSY